MPTCYTHKKVGAKVFHKLSIDKRTLIKKNLPYFLIGLHGPDILFFEPTVGDTHIAEFGHRLHHEAHREFYDNAKMVIRNSMDDRQLVYYFGYLCHLFSDNKIHGVLPELDKAVGVTHAKMECELDRSLMLDDGLDPVTYPVTAHLAVNREVAHYIAPFYLGVSEKQIFNSLLVMKASFSAARSKSRIYRKVVSDGMACAGFADKVPNLVMCADESGICREVMPQLKGLLDEAVEEAVTAIEEITKYIFSDEKMPNFVAFRLDGQKDA